MFDLVDDAWDPAIQIRERFAILGDLSFDSMAVVFGEFLGVEP